MINKAATQRFAKSDFSAATNFRQDNTLPWEARFLKVKQFSRKEYMETASVMSV